MQQIARAIFCFLVLALSVRDARAFCRTTSSTTGVRDGNGCAADGLPLYWKGECVGVHLDRAASRHLRLEDAQTLLVQGFEAWTTAAGACVPSISVVPLAPVEAPKITSDVKGANENDVVFHDDNWPYLMPDIEFFDMVTITFDHETGEILDGDIELNGASLSSLIAPSDGGALDATSSNDLRLLFMHVAGHFLGFSHSQDPASVMFPRLSPGGGKPPELTDDDAAGMCAVYPPTGQRPVVDAQGRQVLIPATACTLTSAGATGAVSSCGSGSMQLDHGCSLGSRSRGPGKEPLSWLGVGFVALLSARVWRRRRP